MTSCSRLARDADKALKEVYNELSVAPASWSRMLNMILVSIRREKWEVHIALLQMLNKTCSDFAVPPVRERRQSSNYRSRSAYWHAPVPFESLMVFEHTCRRLQTM